MVKKLTKPNLDILEGIDSNHCGLLHHTLGIVGEAGEIVDTVKKCIIYKQPLNVENLIEELGDLEFYLSGLRQELGVTRATILEENMDKLNKRYPGFEYTDKRAKERADKQ